MEGTSTLLRLLRVYYQFDWLRMTGSVVVATVTHTRAHPSSMDHQQTIRLHSNRLESPVVLGNSLLPRLLPTASPLPLPLPLPGKRST